MKTTKLIKTILIIWIGSSLGACTQNLKKNQNNPRLVLQRSIPNNINSANLNSKEPTKKPIPKHGLFDDFEEPTKKPIPKYGLFDDLVIFKDDESRGDHYYSKLYTKEYDINFDLFMNHKFYRITKYDKNQWAFRERGKEESGKLKKIKLLFPHHIFKNNLKDLSKVDDYNLQFINLCLSFENSEGKTIDIVFAGSRDDIMAFSQALKKDSDKVPQKFSFKFFIDKKSESDNGYYFYKTKLGENLQEFINDNSSSQYEDETFKLINKEGIDKLKQITDQFSTLAELKKFITSKRFNKSDI
ncbi:hypothetical protein BOFE_09310 (plasmid) [Candidatus Borrelia fainii]|uniref:Lipoprotein n=1 Tax=Candidatus Borrelia fainii TaxID=2518322 RepID=A0ABM8DLC0_9SPIR|nr:hypothetical protein [Candidatus Borrelia fainii]BDU63391.1 hypothetical protein BOFE_09310 [Candidatus Borrelia fainii]